MGFLHLRPTVWISNICWHLSQGAILFLNSSLPLIFTQKKSYKGNTIIVPTLTAEKLQFPGKKLFVLDHSNPGQPCHRIHARPHPAMWPPSHGHAVKSPMLPWMFETNNSSICQYGPPKSRHMAYSTLKKLAGERQVVLGDQQNMGFNPGHSLSNLTGASSFSCSIYKLVIIVYPS